MESIVDTHEEIVANVEEEPVIIHSASHTNVEEIKYLIKKKCNINGLGSYGVPKKIIDYLYFKDKYLRLSILQNLEIRWMRISILSDNSIRFSLKDWTNSQLWGRYANNRDISIYENINIKQFNPQKLKEYSSKELKESLKINKVRGRSNLTNKKKMIEALLKI